MQSSRGTDKTWVYGALRVADGHEVTMSAGALLYVIGEILPVGRRLSWEVTLWGLLAGFLLALATEFVLEVAGG